MRLAEVTKNVTNRNTERYGAALESHLRDVEQHDDDARAGTKPARREGLLGRVPGRWAGFFGPSQRSGDEPLKTAVDRPEDGGCVPLVTKIGPEVVRFDCAAMCSACPFAGGCTSGGCAAVLGRHAVEKHGDALRRLSDG